MDFNVIFSGLKALFPLVYFMQGFQDYVCKVKLNSESALSSGNLASRSITNYVVL